MGFDCGLFLAVREVGGEGFNEPVDVLVGISYRGYLRLNFLFNLHPGYHNQTWNLKSRKVGFCCSVGKNPKKKKRKAGVFKSHIFRFQQWHSFGSSSQNTMPGTWKFHRFKGRRPSTKKARPFSWMCFKVILYFFTMGFIINFSPPTREKLLVGTEFVGWFTFSKHQTTGQIIPFHQPRFLWNKGISLTKPPFGVRSCEVAIIWRGCIRTLL